jgi:hypothetical protein
MADADCADVDPRRVYACTLDHFAGIEAKRIQKELNAHLTEVAAVEKDWWPEKKAKLKYKEAELLKDAFSAINLANEAFFMKFAEPKRVPDVHFLPRVDIIRAEKDKRVVHFRRLPRHTRPKTMDEASLMYETDRYNIVGDADQAVLGPPCTWPSIGSFVRIENDNSVRVVGTHGRYDLSLVRFQALYDDHNDAKYATDWSKREPGLYVMGGTSWAEYTAFLAEEKKADDAENAEMKISVKESPFYLTPKHIQSIASTIPNPKPYSRKTTASAKPTTPPIPEEDDKGAAGAD